MQSGWRVGSLFGIPLFIDPSWFLVILFIAIPRGQLWHVSYPEWGLATAYAMGGLMALLLFASVLMHELGHSLVARAQGIKVNSITLFLFGGVAAIDQESKTPGKAFQVAIAGPAVSLILAALLALLAYVLPGTTSPAAVITRNLAIVNLVLALFNLLPGLPLDGGQVLKALIWKVTGNRFKGARWAAAAGKTLGWAAVLFGLSGLLFRGDYGFLWISLLGWFGVQNANTYDRVTELQEVLLQIQASDAMTREYRVVDADLTLRQFTSTYLLETGPTPVFYAASDGRYRGLVATDEMRFVDRDAWETTTLSRIIHPLTDIPTVAEATSLVEVIQKMESEGLRRITVLSPAGAVAGVIDRGDIVRALGQKMNVPISDAVIRQIKEEGDYPPGMKLGAIAEAAADSLATRG